MGSDELYQQAIEYYCELAATRPRDYFFEAHHDCWTWKGRAITVPLNIWGRFMMTRSKANGKPAEKQKATWNTTFVDIPLTGQTEEEIYGHFKSTEGVYEAATELLESGYRLGFSYNPQNDAFICSVTCKDESSENANQTFTAFAGSWFDALLVALYKHRVVAGGVWSKGASQKVGARFG